MNGLRYRVDQAATFLSRTPAALRKLFERERGRTGAREVRLGGIRAIRRGRHCWIVTLRDPWLVDGRAATWNSLEVAARRFGVAPGTLRRHLERNKQSKRDGVRSTYKGYEARKLGARWLVRLERPVTHNRGARAGATSP
jgi:hypothetical protein